MGQVCAVAAQPGHMKELQLIQLEHGLRIIDSPGVIFDDDEGIQGQIESSVLLRNVVKPEDVDNPISVGEWVLPSIRLQRSPKFLSKVEEILACTQTEKLMKVYNFPTFNTAIEFLMMLTLTTGCLLRISPISFSHLPLSLTDSHSPGRDSRHPECGTASACRPASLQIIGTERTSAVQLIDTIHSGCHLSSRACLVRQMQRQWTPSQHRCRSSKGI